MRENRGKGDVGETAEPNRKRNWPAPVGRGAGLPRGHIQSGRVGVKGALVRFVRFVPGGAVPIAAAEDHTDELAAREAFLSATILGSVEPLAPAALARAPVSAAELEPTASRAQPFPGVTSTGDSDGTVAHDAAPIIVAAVPPAERIEVTGSTGSPEPPTLFRPGQPRETAPDSPIRTPSSVTAVADEFFEGLIRRVESDR